MLEEAPREDHARSVRSTATGGPAPFYLRRVAQHLALHAAQPMKLEQLASLAAVSPRTVQIGFRTYWGCTPMEYLQQRRLELAREKLLTEPACRVSKISLACGFQHAGRFSAAYRERFGESPSVTLRRARQDRRY